MRLRALRCSTSSSEILLGLILLLMGVLGDMLNRHRIYLEELLYRERDRHTSRGSGD